MNSETDGRSCNIDGQDLAGQRRLMVLHGTARRSPLPTLRQLQPPRRLTSPPLLAAGRDDFSCIRCLVTSREGSGSGRNGVPSDATSAVEPTVTVRDKPGTLHQRLRASISELRKQEKVLVICASTAVLMSGHGCV